MSSITDHPRPAATANGVDLPACLVRDNLTSPYFPNTSLATLAAIAALAAVFVLTSLTRLGDAEMWWHLNHGRGMVENAAVPPVDPLAAQVSEATVVHSAWLAERLAYEVHRGFGYEGLVLGHALLITLTAGVLMLAVVRRGAPPVWAWTAAAAMFVLALPAIGFVRPQLFGQLGLAMCLLACAQLPKQRLPLVWLPLVAFAWANLHGSVVIGIVILGIHAACMTLQARRAVGRDVGALWRRRDVQTAWLAPLLMTAAACLNPYGPMLLVRLVVNPQAAFGIRAASQLLMPLSFSGMLLLGSVGLAAVLARYSPRKWQMQEGFFLLIFGLAALAGPGMLAWWAIICPWVCLPHAAAVVGWLCERKARDGGDASCAERHTECAYYLDDSRTAMRTVIAMGIVFAAILISPPTYSIVAGRGRGEGLILSSDTPLYVADEAVRRELAGTVAAPIDWADYLAWKTEGKLRPLIHSPPRLANPQSIRAYDTIFQGDEAWLDALRASGMQYVLVSRSRSPQLARQVLLDDRGGRGGVRILYQDLTCILAEVLPAKSG